MMGCGKHEEGWEGTGRNKKKRIEARRVKCGVNKVRVTGPVPLIVGRPAGGA
jgi:hypothetical protein